MANYINNNEQAYSIIEETEFGVTPTTGDRLDLPTEANQNPLVFTNEMIADNTQRPNRETSAPTRGHESSSGSFSMSLRQCPAIDLLIASAIAGEFDVNGLAFGGERESSFSMFTRLSERGGYQGYVDGGVVVSSFSITGSAKEGVTCAFDLMGTNRVVATAEPTLPLVATEAQMLNYINVKNVKVAGETLEFINLDFSTGMSRDHRVVFGKKNATSIATTGNRETTCTLKGFRKGFEIDALVGDEPVEVSFEITNADGGYRITLPAAICKSPTDELTDTGLLISLEFMGHYDETVRSGITVERL